MKKKVIIYTVGGFAALVAGVFTYAKIVEWNERRGKKVIKDGTFTIIIDEKKLEDISAQSQLTGGVTDAELGDSEFKIDTDFNFEPFNF